MDEAPSGTPQGSPYATYLEVGAADEILRMQDGVILSILLNREDCDPEIWDIISTEVERRWFARQY